MTSLNVAFNNAAIVAGGPWGYEASQDGYAAYACGNFEYSDLEFSFTGSAIAANIETYQAESCQAFVDGVLQPDPGQIDPWGSSPKLLWSGTQGTHTFRLVAIAEMAIQSAVAFVVSGSTVGVSAPATSGTVYNVLVPNPNIEVTPNWIPDGPYGPQGLRTYHNNASFRLQLGPGATGVRLWTKFAPGIGFGYVINGGWGNRLVSGPGDNTWGWLEIFTGASSGETVEVYVGSHASGACEVYQLQTLGGAAGSGFTPNFGNTVVLGDGQFDDYNLTGAGANTDAADGILRKYIMDTGRLINWSNYSESVLDLSPGPPTNGSFPYDLTQFESVVASGGTVLVELGMEDMVQLAGAETTASFQSRVTGLTNWLHQLNAGLRIVWLGIFDEATANPVAQWNAAMAAGVAAASGTNQYYVSASGVVNTGTDLQSDGITLNGSSSPDGNWPWNVANFLYSALNCSYAISGPSTVPLGSSVPITVTLMPSGYAEGGAYVDFWTNNGSFAPSGVTLTPENPTAQVLFTPSAAGTANITPSGSAVNPGTITMSVTVPLVTVASATLLADGETLVLDMNLPGTGDLVIPSSGTEQWQVNFDNQEYSLGAPVQGGVSGSVLTFTMPGIVPSGTPVALNFSGSGPYQGVTESALAGFSNFPVTNNSQIQPGTVTSAVLAADGLTLTTTWDIAAGPLSTDNNDIYLMVDNIVGLAIAFQSASGNTATFSAAQILMSDQTLALVGSAGALVDADGIPTAAVNYFPVVNESQNVPPVAGPPPPWARITLPFMRDLSELYGHAIRMAQQQSDPGVWASEMTRTTAGCFAARVALGVDPMLPKALADRLFRKVTQAYLPHVMPYLANPQPLPVNTLVLDGTYYDTSAGSGSVFCNLLFADGILSYDILVLNASFALTPDLPLFGALLTTVGEVTFTGGVLLGFSANVSGMPIGELAALGTASQPGQPAVLAIAVSVVVGTPPQIAEIVILDMDFNVLGSATSVAGYAGTALFVPSGLQMISTDQSSGGGGGSNASPLDGTGGTVVGTVGTGTGTSPYTPTIPHLTLQR